MQSYLLQQRRALLVSKGMFKRLCGRNWLFIMEIGSYTWTHGLAKPFIPLLLFFITCALLYLSINIIAKMRLRSMKNTFITFAVYSDGNGTSCENKNRFLSKTGSSKSQVVRMANNLMHYPGHNTEMTLSWGGGGQWQRNRAVRIVSPPSRAHPCEHLGLCSRVQIYTYSFLKLCLWVEHIYYPWFLVSYCLLTQYCIGSPWLLINSFQIEEWSRVSPVGFRSCTQSSCSGVLEIENYLSKK